MIQANHSSNLIEIVLLAFLVSRCRSLIDDSEGLRRFEDIRRRNFRKLILLLALTNEVSDDRSVFSAAPAAGEQLNLIGDEMLRDKGCLALPAKLGCNEFGRKALSLECFFLSSGS